MDKEKQILYNSVRNHLQAVTKRNHQPGGYNQVFIDDKSGKKYAAFYKNSVMVDFVNAGNK